MPVRRRSRKSLKTICSSFFRQFIFIYLPLFKYFAQIFQCSLGVPKWPRLVRLSNFDGCNVHDESLVFEVLLRNFRKQNIKSMSQCDKFLTIICIFVRVHFWQVDVIPKRSFIVLSGFKHVRKSKFMTFGH